MLEELRTKRLLLRPVTADDLEPVHAVFSDPKTWQHLPKGCHTERSTTSAMIDRWLARWLRVGMDEWSVISRVSLNESLQAGRFLGTGGANLLDFGVWNLGYRLTPAAWGYGIGTEVAACAMTAAGRTDPTVPVIARVMDNNKASVRVAQRCGLQLAWRGPLAGGQQRLIFADRELDLDVLDALRRLDGPHP